MISTVQDENVFRLVFAVIFCTSIATSGYHRLKARTGEPLDRRQEGIWVFTLLRLGGLAAGLCAISYLIDPLWLPWMRFPVPVWLRWGGAAVGMLAPALLFWALHHLGKNFTDTVMTRRHASLVTAGPYRWVRHPFYVAAAFLFLSAFLVTGNWGLGLAGVVVMSSLAVRTRIEEKNLLQRFGDEYHTYSARTGRFIPRLGR